MSKPAVIVVMGVSGSGKTTIGQKLAASLGWEFRDGDDFHPPANIAKMSAGTPLTDEDRGPWLATIRAFIDATRNRHAHAVIACSALRASYRDVLAGQALDVKFVHLDGDYALILERMGHRPGHFMKPEMLRSQFETLEAPADALHIDIAESPQAIIAHIRSELHLN